MQKAVKQRSKKVQVVAELSNFAERVRDKLTMLEMDLLNDLIEEVAVLKPEDCKGELNG